MSYGFVAAEALLDLVMSISFLGIAGAPIMVSESCFVLLMRKSVGSSPR